MSRFAEIIGHVEVDFVASREDGRLRLWAVDLNVCPTASLSGFQLFDFLAAGQFDPVAGTYWVPGMPEMDPGMMPDQAMVQPEAISSVDFPLAPSQTNASGPSQYQQGTLGVDSRTFNASPDTTAGVDGERQPPAEGDWDSQPEGGQQESMADQPATAMQSAQPSQAGTTGSRGDEAADEVGVNAGDDQPSARPASQMTDMDEHNHDNYEAAYAADYGASASNFTDTPQSMPDALGAQSYDQSGPQTAAAAWQPSQSTVVQQEMQLQPRHYATIDLLFHSGMYKRRSAQFLQNCRLAGLGFDMMARQGLVLNFMDSMSSCCLGVQCAGPSPQAALQGLAKVSISHA